MADANGTVPSKEDWAAVNLRVHKHQREGQMPIYEFTKTISTEDGRTHVQSVWLNQSQLSAVARDHG